MTISTCLISGAGNTFHLVNDAQTTSWSLEHKRKFAVKICEIQEADGFIFLRNGAELSWNFYNNDGSLAEMCGNATRCVGFYVSQILNDQKTTWKLKTVAGPIEIEQLDPENYKVIMTAIEIYKSAQGFYCDTGVPHLIQEIEDFATFRKQKETACELRNSEEFQPRGTNVTYVQLLHDKNKVKAVSFERGVEDFTAACGTGAMAAAAFNLMKRGSAETQVEMPGGTLMMNLSDLNHPVMIGPAKLIGKYEYEESV